MTKAAWIARLGKVGGLPKLKRDYVNWAIRSIKTGKPASELESKVKPETEQWIRDLLARGDRESPVIEVRYTKEKG